MAKRGAGIAPFAGGTAPTSQPIPRAGLDRRTFGGGTVGFGHHDQPQVGPYAGGRLAAPAPQATKKRFAKAQDVPYA